MQNFLSSNINDHNPKPKQSEETSTQGLGNQHYSFRNDPLTILQQKLYQMYILSPDNKQTTSDRETGSTVLETEDKKLKLSDDENHSSKRIVQLGLLNQMFNDRNDSGNIKFHSNHPPLFNQERSEQSFQRTKVPSIRNSIIKNYTNTTPSKKQTVFSYQKSTVKKQTQLNKSNDRNKQSLKNSSYQFLNVCKPSQFSPFQFKKPQVKVFKPQTNTQNVTSVKNLKSHSSSPIEQFRSMTQKNKLTRNISGSRQSPGSSFHRQNISYFQSSPEKKVQQLLHKLIYGKKKNALSQSICQKNANDRQLSNNSRAQRCITEACETDQHNLSSFHPNSLNEQINVEEIENKKSQQLYQMFVSMDSDNDGMISPQKIDLSTLTDDILNFVVDLLYEVDRRKLELSFRQFGILFETYFKKMDQETRHKFLNTQVFQ